MSLTWNASSDSGDGNFAGYNVYRATVSGGPYSLIVSSTAGTAYTDSSVSSTVSYYYVVRTADNDVTTTPQVFIDGECIGGSEELEAFLASAASNA